MYIPPLYIPLASANYGKNSFVICAFRKLNSVCEQLNIEIFHDGVAGVMVWQECERV